jgi:hypothetical protein
LIADIDLDENPQLLEADQFEAVRVKLCADVRVHFLFTSPSGGLKVGFKIKATCPETHLAAFISVRDILLEDFGLVPDNACKDVSRLCYLSYDAEAHHNADAVEIETRAPVKETLPKWEAAPRQMSVGTSPGDQFNERADVEGLLRSQGWTTRNGKHWTRPGKSGGISGTLGVVGDRKFYCWTSSAAPLEANQSYSPFALFATFHHGGDFGAAASALAAEGYGERSAPQPLPAKNIETIETFVANGLAEDAGEPEPMRSAIDILNGMDFANEAALLEREKAAKEMVFVLPGIAARGQATVIYASPNSGKTLLTLRIIRDQAAAGELKDLVVYYCNFDDDFRGANFKGRYVQDLENVKMIDNQNTAAEDILNIMKRSIEDGTAGRICFILDTLIRFVSDCDRGSQREFNKLVQRFIAAQGTIIALGHTNKHKDAEGQSVHGGTADIRNCFSQTAYLNLETDKDDLDRRVRFVNDKLRGMTRVSTCFQYCHGDDKNWVERAQSVERLDEDDANKMAKTTIAFAKRKDDQAIIDFILSELQDGPKSLTHLQREKPANQTGLPTGSRRDRERVLDKYGPKNEIEELRFWGASKGQTGGLNYYLEDWQPPSYQVVDMITG